MVILNSMHATEIYHSPEGP